MSHAAADAKRSPLHPFARVLVRVERDPHRHLRECRAFAALAGGERYAVRKEGPRGPDLRFVSLLLDHAMHVPLRGGEHVHCVVLPLPESSLDHHMPALRAKGSQPHVLEMLVQLVLALDFLHAQGFCHCNLRAEAVVLIRGRWVLGELPDARVTGALLLPDDPAVQALLAPEAILLVAGQEEELPAHPSLDFFLLGLLMFELFVGRPLFKHYRDAQRQVQEDELTIGTGRCEHQVGKYVLENTVCKHPRDRFSAKDLLILLPQMSSAPLVRANTAAILDYVNAGGSDAAFLGGEDGAKSEEQA